jgi:hypothetical protein
MISNIDTKIVWPARYFYSPRTVWWLGKRRSHDHQTAPTPTIHLDRYPEDSLSPFYACAECCMPRSWGCRHNHD